MSYLVLARKYRPQSFEDLVGQSHVAKTLANAIAQDRIAHAFLFTGVRGVGKTTSARLLAKCLNCLGNDGKAAGPTATPCQTCAACTEIAAGLDMDVQEIDGASYNGVDEVRRLQEGLAFRPARDRTKIYIVDEVHMLSNAAWNAFLKTLEEPPPHVKFIFATTEVHKVPVTILSRCQRYDFKLISATTIADRLREVLSKEGIEAEDAAIGVLAREAAGSMRDAMSLLDQVIAYSGSKLVAEDVARVLGVADRAILHELGGAVLRGEAAKALDVIARLAGEGFDIVHVGKDVLAHFRNLVVAKTCKGEPEAQLRAALDVTNEERQMLTTVADEFGLDDLLRVFQGFSKSFDEIAKSSHPRQALEMTLVRLSRRPPLLPLDELLARLGDLEKRLATGAAPPGRDGPPGAGRGGGPRPGGAEPRAGATAPRPGTVTGGTRGGDEPTALFTAPSFVAADRPEGRASAPATMRILKPVLSDAPVLRQEGAAAVDAFVPPAVIPAPPQSSEQPVAGRAAEGDTPAPPVVVGTPLTPPSLPPEALLAPWRELVEHMRTFSAAGAAAFEHAVPVAVDATSLHVRLVEKSFVAQQAATADIQAALARAVRERLGEGAAIRVEEVAAGKLGFATLAEIATYERKKAIETAKKAVEGHPLVRAAIELLQGELREVRVPEE
ncbi:MAG: DNA polymerase III subunit gamma/tau [Myxococcales bacterium]|nr:DNA polymerase III subunit gamma/tau [Myxococcales bacterium]